MSIRFTVRIDAFMRLLNVYEARTRDGRDDIIEVRWLGVWPWPRKCLGAGARDRSLGRAPFVAMMETTDLRDGHDGASAGRCDRTMDRRVFVQ